MDSPQPPSLAITDEEVEQLLQQAESLVGEIADDPVPASHDPASTTPGVAPDGIAESVSTAELLDDPAWTVAVPLADDVPFDASLPPRSDTQPRAADPLQAIENTEAIAAELTAILDEASEMVSPMQARELEASAAEPIPDRSGASPSETPGAIPRAILDEITDELTSGDLSNREPPATQEVATTGHLHPAAMSEQPAEPQPVNDAPAQTVEPAARIPLKARLANFRRAAWFVVTAVPVALVNLVLRLMVLLDRPFARFSAETKLRIGLVALVTLFMGTAAWLLPRIALQNPYAAMGQ
ncbi:MAG TPA: hypothetical protein VJZ71_03330 [Phycisphaerae bacterium]|nr:hypothetical protein [Phycisphaerae bacterium]